MNPVEPPKTDVVAPPLDDLAPARLGMLLRCARKQQSLTRREVAGQIGTTASELRQCERGGASAPPGMIAALADCYGEDLAALFATRAPIQLDRHRMVVGTEEVVLQTTDADEVLGAYIGIVARLRHVKPGEPIALRADDLVTLSTSLGQTSEHIEKRIAELLDCTLHEARSLHSELVRRRVVVPAAGLIAGLAIVAGVSCSAATRNTSPHPARHPAAHTHKLVAETTPVTTRHAGASSTTIAATAPLKITVEGATAQVTEPTTPGVTRIGRALSMYATTTTRAAPVAPTTAVKAARTPPKPSPTTDTTPMSTPPTEPGTTTAP